MRSLRQTGVRRVYVHKAVGQSNGIGIFNNEVLTPEPLRPGRALMASGGIRMLPNGQNGTQADVTLPRSKILDFHDAVEVVDSKSGETGLAQFAADMTGTGDGAYASNEACLVQAHNISGQPMASWCPSAEGTWPYQFDNMIRAWGRNRKVAAERGIRSLAIGAIHAEFMEAECGQRRRDLRDGTADAPDDDAMLAMLERFLAAAGDVARKHFDGPPPPFVFSQMSSWSHYGMLTYSFPTFFLEWWLKNQDRAICAGPSYDSGYMSDGVHRDAAGQRRQYQRHARALQRWRRGLGPLALYPAGVRRRDATTLVVSFAGGEGRLAIDTERVADPGNLGIGWTGEGAITAIRRRGERKLVIEGPVGPGTLHFGTIAPQLGPAGPQTGPRLCLRDSATFVGADGEIVYNWCCFRDLAVV